MTGLRLTRWILAVLLSLASAGTAWAGGANNVFLEEVWVGPGDYVRAKVADAVGPLDLATSCANPRFFAILDTDPNYSELYALMLSALLTGKKVFIYFPDPAACVDNYVIVTRIMIRR